MYRFASVGGACVTNPELAVTLLVKCGCFATRRTPVSSFCVGLWSAQRYVQVILSVASDPMCSGRIRLHVLDPDFEVLQ